MFGAAGLWESPLLPGACAGADDRSRPAAAGVVGAGGPWPVPRWLETAAPAGGAGSLDV